MLAFMGGRKGVIMSFSTVRREASDYVLNNGYEKAKQHYADALKAMESWQSAQATDGLTYALGADGALWQWFGHGAGTAPPAQVEGITDVVAVAQNNGAALHVVRADGTVWCRGINSYGVLGVPGVSRAQDWVQVPGLTDVVSLSMGATESRVLAVRANGTAMSWGSNIGGAIGDGISPIHLTPTRVLLPCRLVAVPSWEEGQGEAQRCQAE